jgi:hypothetical protein
MGEITPAPETCLTPVDDDCDNQLNEEGNACVCLPNTTASCYSGPPGTAGVGICAAGTATCNPDGTALGPCVGEKTPMPESCATPEDEDCDGSAVLCTGTGIWAKAYGNGPSHQAGSAIASDANGNIAVAGVLRGTMNFGGANLSAAGSPDMFLAKLDPSGGHLWSKAFLSGGTEGYPRAVAFDAAGNLYFAGFIYSTTDFGCGLKVGAGAADVFRSCRSSQ